jgi:hemerythrin-like domain-containing protein
MKVTTILMDEHKVILRVLGYIEQDLASLDIIKANINKFSFYFEFISEYSDKLHHKKEEDVYFKWIADNNEQLKNGPIARMLEEHTIFRDLKSKAESNLNIYLEHNEESYLDRMKDNLIDFIIMLRSHINKEDTILYKMAEKLNVGLENGDDLMLPEFKKIQLELLSIEQKYQGFL